MPSDPDWLESLTETTVLPNYSRLPVAWGSICMLMCVPLTISIANALDVRSVSALIQSNDLMETIQAMNFNALDLNLIRVFDALMRERSVTRAGDRIGLSQPAVSAALNRLRHVFNDNLFVRHGSEMQPTPLASELGERARLALAEIEGMVRTVRGLELGELDRTFTLMGADFFSTLLMPFLSHKVYMQAPAVKMRLLDSARGEVARLLQDNAVDMALERPLDTPGWISKELLFRSPFVIIASADNSALADLPEGAVMPLSIFSSLPHVIRSIDGTFGGLVDDALATHGLKRQVTLALPHFHAVASAIAQSAHIAAVPLQFADAVKTNLRLRCFLPPIDVPVPDVNLYWHSRYDEDLAHRWMRDQILQAVAALNFPINEMGNATSVELS
ncbi:LysR family transcriptional regulator [Rhizobium bangladeshense]|uniref:LysR family transcriptional regulator n=1 Tax=Rhizobium bangladeshense TaxID=1138189 RepID=UPI002180AC61|nr:LysR family transcriptional regulator [Rhizobium bangladeshense]